MTRAKDISKIVTDADLSGTLDVTGEVNLSANLNLGDNDKAIFGAGSDLQIYHDGSNSIIEENSGAGSLIIKGTNISFEDGTGAETYATFIKDGAATIRYDNSTKLATKSDGVDITGELQSDSLDVDGNADISGTLTLSSNLDMQDGDVLVMGNGNDLQIQHSGSNAFIDHDGDGSLYLRQRGTDKDIILQSDNGSGGDTDYIICDGSVGEVKLYHYGSEKLATQSDGIYVTGNVQTSSGAYEGASDQDKIVVGASQIDFYINNSNEFRMESDGDFHADGDVIAYSTTISDERLKTDIEKIENATDKVSQLNGYTFTYKADGKKSAGVIAQEVEKVLPSAVSEKELPLKMDDGVAYKTVQYDQIIGLLIESIKELKQEINELKGA